MSDRVRAEAIAVAKEEVVEAAIARLHAYEASSGVGFTVESHEAWLRAVAVEDKAVARLLALRGSE